MIRRLRLALIGFALGVAPCAAAAHWDILWDDPPPRLDRAQSKRVDALLRRAEATYRQMPKDAEALHSVGLVRAYLDRGQCPDAERWLLAAEGNRAWRLYGVVQPALHSTDRACALRMVDFLGDEARRIAGGRTVSDLYLAGALWRRLGQEAKGRAAVEHADRMLDEAERASPNAWTCHGGGCPSRAWQTRLDGLRAYHGTALFAPELRRLAERALADRAAFRRDSGAGSLEVADQVFNELIMAALQEDVEDVAERIVARDPDSAARTLAQARMTALFDEHRFEEGTLLWIEAGQFSWWNLQGAVAVAPGAFHHWRRYLRPGHWQWSDLLVELARAHLKRGDAQGTREAIATLREQAGAKPPPEAEASLHRALGIEAMTDSPDSPVATLAPRLVGLGDTGRELAYSEIAAHQARLGRWREFDRAVAATRGTSSHRELLAKLPCLAMDHNQASLRQALDRAAGGARRPKPHGLNDSEIETGFWCLVEARKFDSAIEAAGWSGKPAEKAQLLAAASDSDEDVGEEARRRLADLALDEVRTHRLWSDHNLLASLAGGYERLGDRAKVDGIIRRAAGPKARFEILLSLLRTYQPYSPKLEWIYGFARKASY